MDLDRYATTVNLSWGHRSVQASFILIMHHLSSIEAMGGKPAWDTETVPTDAVRYKMASANGVKDSWCRPSPTRCCSKSRRPCRDHRGAA